MHRIRQLCRRRKWSNVLFAFGVFLVFGAGVLSAQDVGRPLRQVPPPITIDPNYDVDFTPIQLFDFQDVIINHRVPNPLSIITEFALSQTITRMYIDQYTRPWGIRYLNSLIERANIFMPFIREEVTQRQLPPELMFLPVIESSFVITAISRSGAMGLWQFMLNSIEPFDMVVTNYIDERRDFVKSTRGALQKLTNNHGILGCWHLSLAAYNTGLGRVRRTIQRTGINDYWILSNNRELAMETIHFVPKLIAVSWVLSQPRRFNLEVWHDKFEWVEIPLRRQISIDIIAEEAGIDRELMRRLNSQFVHGITPPNRNFNLVVPAAYLESVNEILEREDLRLLRFHYHVVRHGDTLWSMSRHFGTSVQMLEAHNPGINSRHLRIGETVIIPALHEVTPYIRTSAPLPNFTGTHQVQRGETFWSLGRLYGVDPQVLAEANHMTLNQTLREGRTLNVPILEYE